MKKQTFENKSWVRALPAAAQRQLCSAWALDSTPFAWDNRWGMPLEAAAAGAFAGDNLLSPPGPDIFQQARRWHRLIAFIRHVTALRVGFHNHGLLGQKVTPVNPKKPSEGAVVEWHPGIRALNAKDTDKITKWKAAAREEIGRVVMDCWNSLMLCRNVVTVWRKKGRLIVRQPESCQYTDQFGEEILTIKHGLKEEQINAMPGLSPAERNVLRASPNLKLTHDSNLFFFKVLKEEAVGMGFGWPDLATLFHACSLEESLLVGDRELADAARIVYEQHLLGHEIKSGQHAGSPAHFMKEVRSKAVEKSIKAKKGHVQMTTNFDHTIIIGAGRPKPEMYDVKRYAAAGEQMMRWGMPYGQMLAGVINPYLMTLARMAAWADRQRMQPFLAELMTEALGAPAPVRLEWEDNCFWDSRLLLDLLTKGLASGPISGESFLRGAGFDPVAERSAKERDAALPIKLMAPVFDPAHGMTDKPGKPAGRGDQD